MNEYFLRLISLSLASFFLVMVVTTLIVAAASSQLIRFASRLEARAAARFLFAMRIMPASAAILAVAALCIPSYLWLEPAGEAEDLGALCIAAAIVTVAFWVQSTLRASRAMVEVRRYVRECRSSGQQLRIAGETAWVIDRKRTTIAAGVLHPTVIVSRDVLSALSEEQLEAAILHERAHSASRDNLKRFAILAAPSLFSLQKIEQSWRKYTEWAADDAAVAGDRARALALAEALVRVARIGSDGWPALATPLLGDDFSARVERLVNGPAEAQPVRWKRVVFAFAAMAAVFLRPSTLEFVHRELEKLIR